MEQKNYVITIARGFGTGGKDLGIRLSEELGIPCYENTILRLASEVTGREKSDLVKIDERLRKGAIPSLLRMLHGKPESKAHLEKFESDEEVYLCQKDIIQKLAETESCIIVGKCADYILKDYDHVVSIYVEAPREYCMKRVMDRMKVGPLEAAQLISKTDKYRAAYYQYYTGGNYWTNPVNYDMTLNMGRVGEDRAVSIIKQYLSMKFGEKILENARGAKDNIVRFQEMANEETVTVVSM